MNQKFYHYFGVLTSTFAHLEGNVRVLIAGLAFNGDNITASAFMDNSQLGENINILKKIARKYWDYDESFEEIIAGLNDIRPTRNLFIHGLWSPESFGENEGFAKVTDLKTNYTNEEDMKKWTHGQTKKFTLDDFKEIFDATKELDDRLIHFMEQLSKKEEIEFGQIGFTASRRPVLIKVDDL